MVNKHISKTVYKVHDFISWQRNASLKLSPSFQRRSVWSPSAKSYLIDTVIKGFPVPIIFLRERTDLITLEPIREVVDGQQRLRTLITYISKNLLQDYNSVNDDFKIRRSHNSTFANKEFAQLPENIRKKILDYEFSVHVLPSETEDSEVLQIFARMNSTGVKLNKQELRNAEYYGEMKDLCYKLAYQYLNKWRSWKIFSETEIARMNEAEEVSDLIYMMINGLKGKSQSALDKMYLTYDDHLAVRNIIEARFNNVMEKIDHYYGNEIHESEFTRKALFNTLFTFVYDKLYGINSQLSTATPDGLKGNIANILNEVSDRIRGKDITDELAKILRGATGNLESKRVRLKFISDIYDAS